MAPLHRPHPLRARWLAALCGLLAGSAFAAHPLITEDTATQGVGNAELEHGASWTREGGDRLFALAPQLSFGVLPTLDLLVQPSWASSRTAGSATQRGFGDTALDAKWRFYGEAPMSLALRGGLLVATSQKDLGLPGGTTAPHLTLVATIDAVPWTFHANVGYARLPGATGLRRDATTVSAAANYAPDERWTFTLDLGFDGSTDRTRSSGTGKRLMGVIYTVRPGFDVDIGMQKSLRRELPSTQWLLGLTYRWAP